MAYTLQLGSNGIDVKKMQYYINQILAAPNLTPMEEDGIYGQKTEFAVAVFQYVYHLNVDGILGQTTWDKIIQEFKTCRVRRWSATNQRARCVSATSVWVSRNSSNI